MCPNKSLRTLIEVVGYTPPIYHETKKCYVDFYCLDPRSNKIRRKKYHLDKIKGKRMKKRFAGVLISELSVKLMNGWRPWGGVKAKTEPPKTIEFCKQKFLDKIEKTTKLKTLRSYRGNVSVFETYLKTIQPPKVFIEECDTELCENFLDWLIDNDYSPRTRNNYRTFLHTFFEWTKKRKYISYNPVVGIERIKENPKIRKSLSERMLHVLFNHLKESNPMFLLAVMMEYYTFIRPNELHYIKIGDIKVKDQKIFVSKDYTKNNRDAYVALNQAVILQMIECGIFNYPDEYYIFGKGLKPGLKLGAQNMFSNIWNEVRKELNWGSEYQFYSLKDSGIRDLANSEGIVTARNQARHTDISTTNKYIEGGGEIVAEEAKRFKGKLK